MTSRELFRREVLRWNRSFSLVSRQDPEGQTDRLMRECLQAAELLWRSLAEHQPGTTCLYADLGTGGGFPGLLWAQALLDPEYGGPRLLESHLVEPREKRAWFLEQTGRLMGVPNLSVHTVRWGQGGELSTTAADLLVVSMKALHLSDPDVLSEAREAFPGVRGSVAVVRFATAEDARAGVVDPGLGIPESPEMDRNRPSRLFLPLRDESLHSSLLVSWYPAASF